MKLKAIASVFNRNKKFRIYTTPTGGQWVSNGAAMYSLRGMPRMTPDILLTIFGISPAGQAKGRYAAMKQEPPNGDKLNIDDIE